MEEDKIMSVAETLYECQNCGKLWPFERLELEIRHYHERVADDEDEPAGECPDCGALCHEVEPERLKAARDRTRQ